MLIDILMIFKMVPCCFICCPVSLVFNDDHLSITDLSIMLHLCSFTWNDLFVVIYGCALKCQVISKMFNHVWLHFIDCSLIYSLWTIDSHWHVHDWCFIDFRCCSIDCFSAKIGTSGVQGRTAKMREFRWRSLFFPHSCSCAFKDVYLSLLKFTISLALVDTGVPRQKTEIREFTHNFDVFSFCGEAWAPILPQRFLNRSNIEK